jgi:hypothetical protein
VIAQRIIIADELQIAKPLLLFAVSASANGDSCCPSIVKAIWGLSPLHKEIGTIPSRVVIFVKW